MGGSLDQIAAYMPNEDTRERRCLQCHRVLERGHPKYTLTEKELERTKFCSAKCFGDAKRGKTRAQFREFLNQ
jgi:hypothetical protein